VGEGGRGVKEAEEVKVSKRINPSFKCFANELSLHVDD